MLRFSAIHLSLFVWALSVYSISGFSVEDLLEQQMYKNVRKFITVFNIFLLTRKSPFRSFYQLLFYFDIRLNLENFWYPQNVEWKRCSKKMYVNFKSVCSKLFVLILLIIDRAFWKTWLSKWKLKHAGNFHL
jgi:hypothetical protein